jgi:uncharacterized membrane protein affecting hemolysin expression
MNEEKNTRNDDFYFYMAVILLISLLGVVLMQFLSQKQTDKGKILKKLVKAQEKRE